MYMQWRNTLRAGAKDIFRYWLQRKHQQNYNFNPKIKGPIKPNLTIHSRYKTYKNF